MALLATPRPFLSRLSSSILAGMLAIVLLAPTGFAAPSEMSAINDAKLRGTATYRYLGLPIYDARLYTPGGAALNWNNDIGLQFTYRRNIKKKALIDSTLEEMQRIGRPAPVRDQLGVCFKSVTKGDRYVAVSNGPDKVTFWLNGQKTCTMSYPGITRSFMSVFLGDDTRSASFTQKLRGQ